MADILKMGSQGEEVTWLQEGLQKLGHDPGAIDGDFGPSTESAVKDFQTSNGLTADGVSSEASRRVHAPPGH